MAQNKDCEAQQCIPGAQYRERGPVDSGFGSFNEATIIADPEVENDDFGDDSEAPSVPSEPEAKLAPQQSTASLSSVPNARKCTPEAQCSQQVLLDSGFYEASSTEEESELHGLKSQEDGGSNQLEIVMEEEPHVEAITLANPQHQSNTNLQAGAQDTPDAVVVSLPADDQNTPETVPSPETVATPSEYDKAVGIAEKMDPANWPQPADLQALIEEIKEPTKHFENEETCCLGCSNCNLGYNCTRLKCFAVYEGAKSVFRYWKDGFTPRWKLVLMVAKIFLYVLLSVVAVVKFGIKAHQGDNIVFDSINFLCSLCGCIVSLVYTIVFCIRRRREVRIILCEVYAWIALAVYKCCCCCCKIRRLEELKMRREERNVEHDAVKNYVEGIKMFKPPQDSFQKFTTRLGNTSEVLLTIVDDVILTVVFILSLYNFVGEQVFTIFYGFPELGRIFGFIILLLSALKLIVFVHGLRLLSIAVNVQALDKKVERDSEVVEVELPKNFIQYFFSFQARLVFHVLATSVFQLYGIFALSWKIIQDNCSVVEAPSTLVGNGTNGNSMDPILAGAPFTCSSHPLVNGFTIYNILYIALVPTLLGYTSFFVCNTPWLVEYMQTITMWTYLQIEYVTGHRVREDTKVSGQGEVGRDGGQSGVSKGSGDAKLCRVSERDAYMSPVLQLVRIFCCHLLCDVSDEELCEVGANIERVRQAIKEQRNEDDEKFGTDLSRTFKMLGQVVFFMPAAIIGPLQVVLFIVHLSFLGCCFSSDMHAVFISVPTDIAAVFIPLIILFLLTSTPGPLMGFLWITVAFGISVAVVVVVAVVVAIALFIVAIVVTMFSGPLEFFLLCCICCVCLSSCKE